MPLKAYWDVCKPKVVALMLLTAAVGMALASRADGASMVSWTAFYGLVGIALAAASGASLNHWLDRRLDAMMARTKRRPLPQGDLTTGQVLTWASLLGCAGFALLWWANNPMAALLTVGALLGYAFVYTGFLKHMTPQNIVIGGLSGALPPLLGWVALTGHVQAEPLGLVALIFAWTPAHFWALALYRYEDYQRAQVPMLPITHGLPLTRKHVFYYALLTAGVSYWLVALGQLGWPYGAGVTVLNARWLWWAWRVYRGEPLSVAFQMFHFSNIYLMSVFALMLLDVFGR